MTDYYTGDHFALLNKWVGHKRDESKSEQNQAYVELATKLQMTAPN